MNALHEKEDKTEKLNVSQAMSDLIEDIGPDGDSFATKVKRSPSLKSQRAKTARSKAPAAPHASSSPPPPTKAPQPAKSPAVKNTPEPSKVSAAPTPSQKSGAPKPKK
jgi:hypothetical protein